MHCLDDVARFLPDDPAQLVAASFACPLCLGLEHVAQLVIEQGDSEVECGCPDCRIDWRVGVDAGQVMRLVLHPPAEAATHLRMLAPRTAHAPWARPGR